MARARPRAAGSSHDTESWVIISPGRVSPLGLAAIAAKSGKSVHDLNRVIGLARIRRLSLRKRGQDGGANESEAAKLQELSPIGHACLRTNRLLPDEGLIEDCLGLWPLHLSVRAIARVRQRDLAGLPA